MSTCVTVRVVETTPSRPDIIRRCRVENIVPTTLVIANNDRISYMISENKHVIIHQTTCMGIKLLKKIKPACIFPPCISSVLAMQGRSSTTASLHINLIPVYRHYFIRWLLATDFGAVAFHETVKWVDDSLDEVFMGQNLECLRPRL